RVQARHAKIPKKLAPPVAVNNDELYQYLEPFLMHSDRYQYQELLKQKGPKAHKKREQWLLTKQRELKTLAEQQAQQKTQEREQWSRKLQEKLEARGHQVHPIHIEDESKESQQVEIHKHQVHPIYSKYEPESPYQKEHERKYDQPSAPQEA